MQKPIIKNAVRRKAARPAIYTLVFDDEFRSISKRAQAKAKTWGWVKVDELIDLINPGDDVLDHIFDGYGALNDHEKGKALYTWASVQRACFLGACPTKEELGCDVFIPFKWADQIIDLEAQGVGSVDFSLEGGRRKIYGNTNDGTTLLRKVGGKWKRCDRL